MHFSIPEIREIKNGFKTYIAYDIYINGSFHCSLRYRQLYHFHVQLKKAFGASSLYEFPPKKILPLNSVQVEERRSQLEKYIQTASQDSQIVNSDIFNGFLLAAQQESQQNDALVSSDCIDLYQLDFQPTRLMISANENSQIVLKKYCQTIKLQSEHISYFCLFLVKRTTTNNDYSLVRRLQNFESPLLTLKSKNNDNNRYSQSAMVNDNGNNGHVIIIHKSYWDISFDQDLYEDPVALNIIYLQALHDIEHGHIPVDDGDDIRRRLSHYKENGNKLEYLRLASKLKFYGYVHFDQCHCDCDFIDKKTNVKIFAGNQELIIRPIDDPNNDQNVEKEFVFRVIRIKCWRLTTSNPPKTTTKMDDGKSDSMADNCKEDKGRFELSFEYLVDKTCLKWVTIFSTQAVLISYCLQSMVEEMLLKREGKKFRSQGLALRYNTSPNSNLATSQPAKAKNKNKTSSATVVSNSDVNVEWNFRKKDGSHIPLSSTRNDDDDAAANDQNDPTIAQTLSKQFHEMTIMENGVFNEIGDDDL